MLTLLATLWQSDSAFPSGAFAFSNGIEGLAELGQTLGRDNLGTTLISTLTHRWAGMDRIGPEYRPFPRAGNRRIKHLQGRLQPRKGGSSVGFPCGSFRMANRARPMKADLVRTETAASDRGDGGRLKDAARLADLTAIPTATPRATRPGRSRF